VEQRRPWRAILPVYQCSSLFHTFFLLVIKYDHYGCLDFKCFVIIVIKSHIKLGLTVDFGFSE
jgi:hypothetical protein